MRACGTAVVIVLLVIAGADRRLVAQSDRTADRTAAVLAETRAALGGEARIAGVRTLVATGRIRQVRGDNLVPLEFELQAELPDKYSRYDEAPAQDSGPTTIGFNGNALVQIPPASPPTGRAAGPPPSPEDQAALAQQRVAALKEDFARLMLGMFATAFGGVPLTFTYIGQAESPQGRADVVNAMGSGNFAARLFIDAASHLPLMVSWQAPPPAARGAGPPSGTSMVEHRMFFADHRDVEGLRVPFRIRRAVGPDTIEEASFDRIRINGKVDPRRFEPRS
jgi:hypothetical protein